MLDNSYILNVFMLYDEGDLLQIIYHNKYIFESEYKMYYN